MPCQGGCLLLPSGDKGPLRSLLWTAAAAQASKAVGVHWGGAECSARLGGGARAAHGCAAAGPPAASDSASFCFHLDHSLPHAFLTCLQVKMAGVQQVPPANLHCQRQRTALSLHRRRRHSSSRSCARPSAPWRPSYCFQDTWVALQDITSWGSSLRCATRPPQSPPPARLPPTSCSLWLARAWARCAWRARR